MATSKEEAVTLDKCPAKVQETIKKEPKRHCWRNRKSHYRQKVFYEAEITVGEDKYELTISSNGKLLKKELEAEETKKMRMQHRQPPLKTGQSRIWFADF